MTDEDNHVQVLLALLKESGLYYQIKKNAQVRISRIKIFFTTIYYA